jgi:serine/threonine-protein kinase RsbW
MPSRIALIVPAEARYLRIARLTGAGIAGDLGFGLQDIEDLRIAIDEMCAALIDGADPGLDLSLDYLVDGDVLEIEGRCPQPGEVPDLHPVAKELLTLTADEFKLYSDAGGRAFRLVKHRDVDPE